MIKFLWQQLLTLIYPDFCLLCDRALAHGSAAVLCPDCQDEVPILSENLCQICGKPLVDLAKPRCLDCRRRVHFFEEGRALWPYENKVKTAIKAYKYNNRREMGPLFAKVMAKVYNDHMDWPVDMVIPVPLHPKKERARGFSQTGLMADIFMKETGLPLEAKALKRHTATKAQEGLSEKERLANVMHAFVADSDMVRGRLILLIDDVYTTGATLDGCAKALIDAGAKKVYFMTVAIGRGY